MNEAIKPCEACGGSGKRFVPPSLGEEGFYIPCPDCKPPEIPARLQDDTEEKKRKKFYKDYYTEHYADGSRRNSRTKK